jgi:hypothetical protein
MPEVEAIAALEGQWQPVTLCHVARGLRWQVREVLDGWTHPGWPGRAYQKPVAQKWYRLRVFGPLPGRPDQRGKFVMIATSYATGTIGGSGPRPMLGRMPEVRSLRIEVATGPGPRAGPCGAIAGLPG